MSCRILLTGGSTAGHVTSCLAVVEAIRRVVADSGHDAPRFLYVGSRDGSERALAEAAGIPFRSVATGKLRAYASAQNLVDPLRIPLGVAQSMSIVGGFRPHVAFSTGGFGAVPPTMAAWILRVPVVTHDQTTTIGLANQIISSFAAVTAVSHPGALDALRPRARARGVVTGNPTRASLLHGDPVRARVAFDLDADDGLPAVYVTGGSLGARAINRAVEQELDALLGRCLVIHQCGAGVDGGVSEHDRLKARAEALPDHLKARYRPVPFLAEQTIADVYALADLVVGRAGAGTTSELVALGKPGVLIPLRPTRRDEQYRNAMRLADADAALVIDETEADSADARDAVLDLIADPARLRRMAARAATLATPGAAETLARLVLDALKPGSRRTEGTT